MRSIRALRRVRLGWGARGFAGPTGGEPEAEGPGTAPPGAKLTDAEDEALMRSIPGVTTVAASADLAMRLAGKPTDLRVSFYRGDFEQVGYRLLSGRWFDGPGQVVVSERFLRQRGLAVGDTITRSSGAISRERRRDLGMLKSIGMTPAQVIVMVVTSMTALGALGGLLGIPLGIIAHRLVVPAMASGAQIDLPDFMLDVYPAGLLALLVLAGILIAAAGAYVPARSAARTTIAEVLHNE